MALRVDHGHHLMKMSCYGTVIGWAKQRIYDSNVVAGTMITAIATSDLSFAPITYGFRNSHAGSNYLVAG